MVEGKVNHMNHALRHERILQLPCALWSNNFTSSYPAVSVVEMDFMVIVTTANMPC